MIALWIATIILIFCCLYLALELRKTKQSLRATNSNHADAIKRLYEIVGEKSPQIIGAKVRPLSELSERIGRKLERSD